MVQSSTGELSVNVFASESVNQFPCDDDTYLNAIAECGSKATATYCPNSNLGTSEP